MFEAFSMMKEIHNLEDFDNWARTVLLGGKIDPNAADRTGALLRSLQETMSHSILSGLKHQCKLMGTSAATML